MRNCILAASLIAGALVGHTTAIAQTATFRFINENAAGANDMSPDGRWVVGTIAPLPACESIGGYLYDTVNDVFTVLPPPAIDAVSVSDDGTVIVGNMPDPDTGDTVAAIWRASTNEWESLGFLPNADACPSRSTGYEVSGDGATVVGLSWEGCSGRGFIWTEAEGMRELQALANGSNRASVVSYDGSIIGGFAQGSFSRTPTMWNSTLAGQLLDPPNGDVVGEVRGMTDDGSVLLASGTVDENAPAARAVKWTEENGFEVIGNGSVFSAWAGNPEDIAADGTVVGFDSFLGSRQAWIQPGGEGNLVALKNYATDLGAEFPAGLQIEVAQAISNDGSIIIGHGRCTGAWIIEIENSPECSADLNDDGIVDGADLASLLAAWGSTNNPADLNGDGVVDGADLATLLSLWNASC